MYRTLQDMEGNLSGKYNLSEVFGELIADANKIDFTMTPEQFKKTVESLENNLRKAKLTAGFVEKDFNIFFHDDRLAMDVLYKAIDNYRNDPNATTDGIKKIVDAWNESKRPTSSVSPLVKYNPMDIVYKKTANKIFELPKTWIGNDKDEDEKFFLMSGLPTIIGGYTAIGKTTFTINMAYYFMTKNVRQQFYSLEMSGESLAIKLLRIAVTNKNYSECDFIYYDHKLTEFVYEGKGELREKYVSLLKEISNNIEILGNNITSELTIDAIEDDIRMCYTMGTLAEIVYIDYAQLIRQSDKSNIVDPRHRIIEVMGKLTTLAKKYNFALVLISQTNRADTSANKYETKEDTIFVKAPNLFSLAESSSIEQNAGLVITVGREKTGSTYDYLHLSIEKNRFGSSGKDIFVSIKNSTQAILKHEPTKSIPEKDPQSDNKSNSKKSK